MNLTSEVSLTGLGVNIPGMEANIAGINKIDISKSFNKHKRPNYMIVNLSD